MALITDGVAQGMVDLIAANERAAAAAMTGGFYALLTASNDPDVETVMGKAADAVDLAIAGGNYYASVQGELYNALMQQLALVSQHDASKATYATMDAYLAARGWRVPIEFATVAARQGGSIAKAYVFDTVKEMGTFAVSGAGAGTFTDGVALDSTNTSGNNLEAYVAAGKSATNVALDVTCVLADNTTEVKSITVDVALDDTVRTVAIGDGDDVYINISSVSITSGGVNGEQVKFRSKADARS